MYCFWYGFGLCSTTCSTTLHYMAGNDYRSGRRQVSFVVDESLWAAVKGVAAGRGWSVTRLVTELLEKEVGYGDAGVGPRDREGSGASGGVDGALRGGGSGGDTVSGVAGRGVDWDSLLVAGRAAKVSVVLDPIEEIA